MVSADDPSPRCRACRLNAVIPDLDDPVNLTYWKRIEQAKRRLIYTLLELELPLVGKDEDPDRGLAFRFIAESKHPVVGEKKVMTGHASGTITVNVAEANPAVREKLREELEEDYRTLLGHFRHEIGHYYWSVLVAGDPVKLARFRALFGDERDDYADALRRHYANGPPADWAERHISAYASTHPWEDWAECWAHYLHMVDTVDTALDMGFTPTGVDVGALSHLIQRAEQPAPNGHDHFDGLLSAWFSLSVTLNALNRSMGLRDAYPFVLGPVVVDKLRLVHDVVTATPHHVDTVA
jgi:hypothetical protein